MPYNINVFYSIKGNLGVDPQLLHAKIITAILKDLEYGVKRFMTKIPTYQIIMPLVNSSLLPLNVIKICTNIHLEFVSKVLARLHFRSGLLELLGMLLNLLNVLQHIY